MAQVVHRTSYTILHPDGVQCLREAIFERDVRACHGVQLFLVPTRVHQRAQEAFLVVQQLARFAEFDLYGLR